MANARVVLIAGASGAAATRIAERALNPLIGKSMVLYFRKPEVV